MKKLLFVFLLVGMHAIGQDTASRWSREKIWNWYDKQPWLCGFNYIPAYAINYTAMWDKTTYDCAFGIVQDPAIGRQPEPLTGWYAWAWSPVRDIVWWWMRRHIPNLKNM